MQHGLDIVASITVLWTFLCCRRLRSSLPPSSATSSSTSSGSKKLWVFVAVLTETQSHLSLLICCVHTCVRLLVGALMLLNEFINWSAANLPKSIHVAVSLLRVVIDLEAPWLYWLCVTACSWHWRWRRASPSATSWTRWRSSPAASSWTPW